MPPSSSTVASWELGLRLKEIREELDWKGIDAAKLLGLSQNYLSDVEHGKRKISANKLAELLDAYSVSDNTRKEMTALRNISEEDGWWLRHKGFLAPELIRLLGCEHGAQEVHSYEGAMISGLLQTERYSHAVHSGDSANLRMSDIERRVEIRSQRQQRLVSPDDPLSAVIVMAEASLRQQVGGPAILREQLEHLLSLLDNHPDTLDIRIIPFTSGSYGALGSSTFHLLTFPGAQLRRLAWQETVTWLQLIDSPERIHQYSLSFNEALRHTADREDSKRIIKRSLADA